MPPKKVAITAQEVEGLARSGMKRGQIAKFYGLSYSGFSSRLDRESELREAMEDGERLAFEDLVSEVRSIALDQGEKSQARIQAFDKLARWAYANQSQTMQASFFGSLSDAELVAFKESLVRKRLEDRLSVCVNTHAGESEPERQKVTTGSDVQAEAE